MGENEILQAIKHRERYCRMCGNALDFDAAGIMRDVRHVRYTDGVNRQEMFAFCCAEHQVQYRNWEKNG